MLNTWVKNVYSLCLQCIKTSAKLYTTPTLIANISHQVRVQPKLLTHNLNSFAPLIYTPKNYHLTPTNRPLSTLSTAPTIKKNKKK
jgi:hypothetical protein